MYLDQRIKHNATQLRFRVMLPEKTSKRAQYPYQKVLTDYADQYLRRNHPGAKCSTTQLLRYQEVYDGCPYLQLTIPIYNHKNEEKIIEVFY
jgi:hypothetical protein